MALGKELTQMLIQVLMFQSPYCHLSRKRELCQQDMLRQAVE